MLCFKVIHHGGMQEYNIVWRSIWHR